MCPCLEEKIDCKIQLQVWAGGRVLKKKKKNTHTQKQINSVDVVCTLTWKQKPNYLNVVSGDKNEHFLLQNVLTRT